MPAEFSGIERRLQRLDESIQRLEALRDLHLADFLASADLRDIAERNLEVAAQCCIDIAHRIVALEGLPGPRDAQESLLRLPELGVTTGEFAERFAAIAGFRSVLAHEYLAIDWRLVHAHLREIRDFEVFAASVRRWLARRTGGDTAD